MSAEAQTETTNSFVLTFGDATFEVRVRTTSVVARKELSQLQKEYAEKREAIVKEYIANCPPETETVLQQMQLEAVMSQCAARLQILDDEYTTMYARILIDAPTFERKYADSVKLIVQSADGEFWQSQNIKTLMKMYEFFRGAANG